IRPAAFQSLLAPPQGTTGHGTGGDGTAVESPTFPDPSPPAARLCWLKNAEKRRELTETSTSSISLLRPPFLSTQAPGTRQARRRNLQEAVACTRHPPPGHLDFRAFWFKSVGLLCPTFAKCRTRTGFDSNSKAEFDSGPHEAFWELTGFGFYRNSEVKRVLDRAILRWVTNWEVAGEFPNKTVKAEAQRGQYRATAEPIRDVTNTPWPVTSTALQQQVFAADAALLCRLAFGTQQQPHHLAAGLAAQPHSYFDAIPVFEQIHSLPPRNHI
ncbi:hypothetical protein Prudu_016527, partial [Prunus dulcis]